MKRSIGPLRRAVRGVGRALRARGQLVSSALTVAEASRAILRARLSGRIATQQQRAALLTLQRFVRRCYIVSISEQILAQAIRLFPVEPVRTLDAIHLATVQAVAEAPGLMVVLTRDQRIRDNAIALGYSVE